MNLTNILEQVSKIQVKSITDSLFKYGVYILIVGTTSAIFKTANWVTISLFSLGGFFEITGLITFFYFVKKNPDYLRSEGFQLRKQSIEILGDKTNKLNPNLKEIVSITSPYSKTEETEL